MDTLGAISTCRYGATTFMTMTTKVSEETCDLEEKIATILYDLLLECLTFLYADYLYSLIGRQLAKGGAQALAEADDLYGSILVALAEDNCKRLRSYAGKNSSSFRTYLTTVVMNLIIDETRKSMTRKKRERRESDVKDFSLDAKLSPLPGPEDDLMSQIDASILSRANSLMEAALNDLPADDRLLLSLKFIDGLSYREIDEALDTKNAAYLVRCAVQKLRQTMTARGFAEIREELHEIIY